MGQTSHPSTVSGRVTAVLAIVSMLAPAILRGDQVLVRHRQGALRGFLILRTADGAVIADGEVSQVVSGTRVTSKTDLHFKDGSTQEETTIFSQSRGFRLQSDHMVQRGPSFPNPIDAYVDCGRGQIEVRYPDDKGQEKLIKQHMDLPADLANGVLFTMLTNLQPDSGKTTVSLLVTSPKPRIVRVNITPSSSRDSFWVGSSKYEAMHYVLKIDIGGIAGAVAPLVGKQPADTNVWILDGDPPLLVKFAGQFFSGGPVWQMELAAPNWTEPGRNSQ